MTLAVEIDVTTNGNGVAGAEVARGGGGGCVSMLLCSPFFPLTVAARDIPSRPSACDATGNGLRLLGFLLVLDMLMLKTSNLNNLINFFR